MFHMPQGEQAALRAAGPWDQPAGSGRPGICERGLRQRQCVPIADELRLAHRGLQRARNDLPENVLSGGVVLNWPILEGGTIVPRIQAARLAIEEAKLRREQLRANVGLEVRRAVTAVAVAEDAYRTQQQVVAAKITAPFDAKVPGGLLAAGAGTSADRFVAEVYQELKRAK